MITFTHTCKTYTDRILRSDFHHTITGGSKIALIGPNGCGKSTMLACITGKDTVDEGSINTKGLIAYIPQEISDKYLNFTIEEYRYQYLPSHDDLYLGYIAMDQRGIQFDITTPLKQLSGGQRKIIQLITLQFKQYDIIILDEPTNHLDIQIKQQLSDLIITSKAIIICVTHDRYFINQRSQQVRLFDHGTIKTYPGNYDDYTILHEQAQLSQQRAHESVAKELEHQTQVLAEFKRRSKISSDPKRGKMIRTRTKIIERMQSKQADQIMKNQEVRLTVISHTRKDRQLLNISNMDVNIAGQNLISDINLTVYSDDKIAILGPNGSGKTTFIKQLLKTIQNQGDTIKKSDLTRSYIDQLNVSIIGELSVIDRYIKHCPGNTPDHVATHQLLQFGFTHGQMKQSINSSSYGQKLKLKILTSIKSAVDLIILDEPTNHLDIVTIEALERMISQYNGAIIMISHDPYFIANCAINTLYHIRNQKLEAEHILNQAQ